MKKLFSIMSNYKPTIISNWISRKWTIIQGGKWLIHVPKHHKDN